MLLKSINGREIIFAFYFKFEKFQSESYHDKRKRGVLGVNDAEEHSLFNKVLKENKELKARTESFRNK